MSVHPRLQTLVQGIVGGCSLPRAASNSSRKPTHAASRKRSYTRAILKGLEPLTCEGQAQPGNCTQQPCQEPPAAPAVEGEPLYFNAPPRRVQGRSPLQRGREGRSQDESSAGWPPLCPGKKG